MTTLSPHDVDPALGHLWEPSSASGAYEVCPCEEPTIVDRVCTTCHKPHLGALLGWYSKAFCGCEVPDVEGPGGLKLRICNTCGRSTTRRAVA